MNTTSLTHFSLVCESWSLILWEKGM